MYALKFGDIRLIRITTVLGNVSMEQAANNSLRVIELAGVPYDVSDDSRVFNIRGPSL
ncbi:MAG: Inosine-uridine preferring nucleoside hydrolase [Cohnella sp.]|jgi:inosine-uridine nucleoside N-ribohydrolase|nr:Inosine-uridine preferring nucleoside hydrolase [Cohnella sp.]